MSHSVPSEQGDALQKEFGSLFVSHCGNRSELHSWAMRAFDWLSRYLKWLNLPLSWHEPNFAGQVATRAWEESCILCGREIRAQLDPGPQLFSSGDVLANLRDLADWCEKNPDPSGAGGGEGGMPNGPPTPADPPRPPADEIEKGKPGRRGYPLKALDYAKKLRVKNPTMKAAAIRMKCLERFSEDDLPPDAESFRRWLNRKRANRAN